MLRSYFRLFFIITSLFSISYCIRIRPRIVNGFDSRHGQFPFYAFLKLQREDTKIFYCGGTLLNENFVLTAGHCVYNITHVELHLGSLHKDCSTESGRIISKVSRRFLHIHPHYEHKYLTNDIALIKLRKPIEFSDIIQPVYFPNECDIAESTDLLAIGNGRIGDGDKLAATLQFTTLTTISSLECSQVYPFINESTVFCATALYNGAICEGDSGGPLIHVLLYTFYGISSFAHHSGVSGLPQGFTNVLAYLPWISEVTEIQFPSCH